MNVPSFSMAFCNSSKCKNHKHWISSSLEVSTILHHLCKLHNIHPCAPGYYTKLTGFIYIICIWTVTCVENAPYSSIFLE